MGASPGLSLYLLNHYIIIINSMEDEGINAETGGLVENASWPPVWSHSLLNDPSRRPWLSQ